MSVTFSSEAGLPAAHPASNPIDIAKPNPVFTDLSKERDLGLNSDFDVGCLMLRIRTPLFLVVAL
jgi:hypothetical protein